MQRQTTIAAWCERIIEGGWLLALVLIPSYFNLLSSRHFEPDKATAMRAIVLIMAGAGIIRVLERGGQSSARKSDAKPAEGFLQRVWRRINAVPLALPALIYTLVFVFTTFTSVVPGTSFWGSYQRLQGTYTNLSYIALAAMIVLTLRSREQFERLLIVAVLGSLPAIGYGLVQHFQIDPLPWKGDVVSRVASTMGNSIFVAAYLIMIVPFTLYRAISAFQSARQADEPGDASDFGWGAAYLLLVLGGIALVYATIKFGAVVRTVDLRYWWVYPASLFVLCGLFILPTLRPHNAERITGGMLWPGVLAILFVLSMGMFYLLGQASGGQAVQPWRGGNRDTDWPTWLIVGLIFIIISYALLFTLPKHAAPSRLLHRMNGVGMLVLTTLLLVTIFFTQSRGPWLGIGAGLFVFFTLLLWRAYQRARADESPRANLWRGLLLGEVAATLLIGGFLIAFNLSSAPFFEQLRAVPYVGRMGTLLETDSGTGLVRRLIWFGDDKAGGAVGLITSNPLRTVIGWGPESMFVAYNPFYPPSLANIEARGASPDRSHEAYLDELVTKGLLGLISYLFVIISFFALAWRLIRRVGSWQWEVLFIAAISVVVAHSVEGLTGIPIVSTLMMLWITFALTVVGGALAGQYSLDDQPAVAAVESEPEAVPAKGQPTKGGRRRQGQGAVARGAAQGRAVRGGRAASSSNGAALVLYALIGVASLAGAWFFNADNIFADMRFQQGQSLSDNPQTTASQQLDGMARYLEAIQMEPQQDFYYLSFGRSLMSVAETKRQNAPNDLGQTKPNASMSDLLRLSGDQAVQFVQQQKPLEVLSYAETVLERARDLNPRNKDHYANLARLNNFWYARVQQDPARLDSAVAWYEKAHEVAPQDVVILNEYASAVALKGDYARRQSDATTAQQYFTQADDLLKQSRNIDARYGDTNQRIAEVLRLEGRDSEAADQYVTLIQANPHALDGQITQIADSLSDQPDALRRLRDAYAAASAQKPDDAALLSFMGLISVRLQDMNGAADAFSKWTKAQPDSIDARRNYTLVLSETKQYPAATVEAQTLLDLAQKQQRPQEEQSAIQGLVNFLKERATAGG